MSHGGTKNILHANLDNGNPTALRSSTEGHLEVGIHEPLTAFGEVATAQMTPIFQTDFVYGVNQQQCLTVTQGTGSIGTMPTSNSMLQLSSGATSLSYAVAESRKRARYRSGEGLNFKFTGMYTSPVANSYQCVGAGTAENGVYFGYGDTSNLSNTNFGILYVRNGKREIRTLTLSTGSTGTGSPTIVLNNVTFNTLTGISTANNVNRLAYEISQNTFAGWDTHCAGATVVFIKRSAGACSTGAGAFSYTASGATGSSAANSGGFGTDVANPTRAGANSTDTFINQSSWNIDTCDGSGSVSNPSGFNLDPQKLNIFQIQIGYLGAHDIIFKIKIPSSSTNNVVWKPVHVIKYINLNTTPNFSNCSLPFTAFVYSAGSTTNLTVSCASFAAFVEGEKHAHGPRASYYNSLVASVTSTLTTLISILNPRTYNNLANQSPINLLTMSIASDHSSPLVFYLVKHLATPGGTMALSGNPNFTTYSSNTMGLQDTAGTTFTISSNNQILGIYNCAETSAQTINFSQGELNAEELTIQPGEYISVCAKTMAGTNATASVVLNTREDF
jgi:hypothetical protein